LVRSRDSRRSEKPHRRHTRVTQHAQRSVSRSNPPSSTPAHTSRCQVGKKIRGRRAGAVQGRTEATVVRLASHDRMCRHHLGITALTPSPRPPAHTVVPHSRPSRPCIEATPWCDPPRSDASSPQCHAFLPLVTLANRHRGRHLPPKAAMPSGRHRLRNYSGSAGHEPAHPVELPSELAAQKGQAFFDITASSQSSSWKKWLHSWQRTTGTSGSMLR